MALTDNLVSYWKLDESSGDAADSVGSNTGTNTSVTYSTGKINNGAVFNGSAKLSPTNNSGLKPTDFTTNVWIKTTDATDQAIIGNCLVGGNIDGWRLWMSGTTLAVDVGNDTGTILGTNYGRVSSTVTGLNDGTWRMVTASFNSTTNVVSLYHNGILLGAYNSYTGDISYNASATFQIGDGDLTAFVGSMDEIGYWSRALTADEVSQLYSSNRALAYPLTAPTLYGGVAYYKLDESSGNASDSIGNVGTLTNNNTTTYATGKINNGAVFNGTNQFLNSSSVSATTNSWTFAGWINPDDADIANQTFFSYRPSSGNINVIQFEGRADRTIRCIVYGSNGTSFKDYRTSVAISQSAWSYFVATWDGTNLKIYINGTEDTSVTKTQDDSVTQTLTARTLRLGAETAASNFWDGNIDEFALFNRALTQAEITTLYAAGNGKQYPWTGTIYTLALDVGSFVLTGFNLAVQKTLTMIMSAGSYALTGIDILFQRGRGIILSAGSFILTGLPITFRGEGSWKWRTKPKSSSSWTNTSKNSSTWTNLDKSE